VFRRQYLYPIKCTFQRYIHCVDIVRRSSARGLQTTLRWQNHVFIHTRLSRAYLALARLSCIFLECRKWNTRRPIDEFFSFSSNNLFLVTAKILHSAEFFPTSERPCIYGVTGELYECFMVIIMMCGGWTVRSGLQVQLSVDNGQLLLIAQCLDDRESAVFKKTMIRKLDVPKYVDHKMLHCQLTDEGILHIDMPFHLPPQRRPVGPSVLPVVSDLDGSRRIRMSFMLGPDFTADDVRVELNGRTLSICAGYDAEIGLYGSQVVAPPVLSRLPLP